MGQHLVNTTGPVYLRVQRNEVSVRLGNMRYVVHCVRMARTLLNMTSAAGSTATYSSTSLLPPRTDGDQVYFLLLQCFAIPTHECVSKLKPKMNYRIMLGVIVAAVATPLLPFYIYPDVLLIPPELPSSTRRHLHQGKCRSANRLIESCKMKRGGAVCMW